jgi:hypothetical protein
MFKYNLLLFIKKINSYNDANKFPSKKIIWNHYIGDNKSKFLCLCCEKIEINPFDFCRAHVVAKSLNGLNNIENIRPCCKSCNESMGTENFFVYKSKLFNNRLYNDFETNETKNIINIYNKLDQHLSTENSTEIYNELIKILKELSIIKNDNEIIKIKCHCKFEDSFIETINNNKISYSIKSLKHNQTLTSFICDHLYCLMKDNEFIKMTNNIFNKF